jgi:formyl-CoA transferase
MDLVRASPDVPPARSLPGMGDHPTGTSLFAAIMAGLYHRERTGRGTMVATSLMANGLWMNAIPVQGILCGARTEVRPPREEAISALANLYRCRDARWFMLTITGDERHWESFVRGIGREDLLTDPRFAATHDRRTNARALTAILDAWFGTKDWAAWSAILEKTGIAFGVVATLDDAPHDVQMRGPAALWCQSTTHGPAPRSPCRAPSRSPGKRRFHQYSRRRSGSTPSRCCAPPALPRRRSSDSCKPG